MANRPHRRPRNQVTPSLLAIAAALLVIFLAAAIMYVLMPLITVSDGGTASNAISAPRTSGGTLRFDLSPTPPPTETARPEATSTPTATSTLIPTEAPTHTPTTAADLALASGQPTPIPTVTRWSAAPTPTAPRVSAAAAPTTQSDAVNFQPPTAVPSPTASATPTPSVTATSAPSPTAAVAPEPTLPPTVESKPDVATDTPEPAAPTPNAANEGRRPHAKLIGSPISN